MKKTTFFKTMLLLCALVVGSGNLWAGIDVTATLTGSALATAAADGYTNHTTPLIDDKGNQYVGNWYNAQKSKVWYNTIQLGAISASNTSHVTLPKYDGKIKTITLSVTSSSGTSEEQSGKEAKVIMNIVNGSAYTKSDISSNGILSVDHSTDDTKSFEVSFDFTTLGTDYDGEGLYICSSSGSLRIWEMVVVYEVTTVPAKFAAGKTMISYSKPFALDFTDVNRPDGLKAYKVSAADNTSVTLTEVTSTVAANTGLILTGSANTDYPINAVASGTNISETNKLVATDGTSTVSDAAVVSAGEFHPLTSGVIAAGKAYLPYANIEGGDPFAGGARALDIVFKDDVVTGITSIEKSPVTLGNFYDLQGRKVAQPKKGLYIVNGKKVIIK